MFDLGLALKPSDFKFIITRPKPVLLGLFGQIVLLPLIAWGIAVLFHLSPYYTIGLMLIACSPGGSSSNVFSMLARGDVALSVTLTAFSSIITLFTLPLIMAWVTASVGAAVNIQLPVGNLLMQNIVLMAVPVGLGLLISVKWPDAAAKMHAVLKQIAMPGLIILVSIFLYQHRQTIAREFTTLGMMTFALIMFSTVSGAILAQLFHQSRKVRRTLVIEIGMQNAAQAVMIACSPLIFNNEVIAIPAIIYALMMNIILLCYVGYTKLQKE